jgi:hypothetical protein
MRSVSLSCPPAYLEKRNMNSNILREIFSIHFDKRHGAAYWLDRQRSLGIDVVKEITFMEELHRLGAMEIKALRSRSLLDFIPRCYHQELSSLLLSETGGTTGDPCRRVFSPAEFDRAFIEPWKKAVTMHGFPERGTWLFVGPGGPHIIDRSARAMARALGSLEPFSVDCDVRWIKKQKKGSLGFSLYLDHVLSQAMNIIGCQTITTLFTTPPLLQALGQRMTDEQRERIKGIHTGGLSLTTDDEPQLRALFPDAVILPGYGNSLFGVTFPLSCKGLDTFQAAYGDRLLLQLAPLPEHSDSEQDLQTHVTTGQRGRVICHCLDKSFLLINLVERDTAVASEINGARGLSAIEPLALSVSADQQGVY